MPDIVERMDNAEADIKCMQTRIEANTKWIDQTKIKLSILFGVLGFLALTFSGLIITLLWEIFTHKIVLGG
jgi:uncharacterized membrane protein SpoIIM required for sporulation